MAQAVDISHIVTVYNKARYLPDTIASLLEQEGGLTREFIFVDDVSTDDSVKVIEEETRGRDDVTIVRNTANRGPSVRLNQGAKLARGKYLHFLDSDDMIPVNAMAVMHRAIEETGADLLYGKWLFTHQPGATLSGWRIPEEVPARQISEDPLATILEGRNRRMCLLVTRQLFEQSGGADERVFIQDESLPLRLSIHAKSFLRISAYVNLIPLTEENLSGNRSQLNHDRFFAYRNALIDYPQLPLAKRKQIYAKCLSATWKQYRMGHKFSAHFSPLFLRYLKQSLLNPAPDLTELARMTDYFSSLTGIRLSFAS